MKTVIRVIVLIILLLSFFACDSEMDDGAVLILPLSMGLYASPDWGAEDIRPGGLIVFAYEDYGFGCLILLYCNEYGSVIGQIPTANDYDPFNVSEPSWAPSRMEVVCKLDNSYTMEEGLYICDAFGNLELLVAGEFCGTPNWSPDGTKIAYLLYELYEDYVYVYNIFVIDADGGTPIRLTTSGVRSFDWFPDGERILYQQIGNGLISVNVNTGETVDLSDLSSGIDYMDEINVSPDGERVAFEGGSNYHPVIYVLNLRTEDIKQVTAGEYDGTAEFLHGDFQPTWSPDGEWIAFVSARGKSRSHKLYKIRVF